MPISVTCAGCGKKLKGKDNLAGRTVACPNCGGQVTIPKAEAQEDATYKVAEPSPASAASEPREPVRSTRPISPPPAPSLPPLRSEETPFWLRHLHWLLVLALIPLVFSLLQKDDAKEDEEERLLAALRSVPEEDRPQVERALVALEAGKGSVKDLIAALPGHKLPGAFLPARTWMHWAFAGGSALLFMTFFVVLASGKAANPLHILGLGFFTATIGILFLLLVQLLAAWSQGVWVHGRSIVVILFYLVKLIGYSYRAALDPENGFFLSFLGFTFGVGFCEEVCKALPLLWHYRRPTEQAWRGAFLWGLASGAGFGISEGITYASDFYNGISGSEIYYVRFISCVALHALWTGSVAITLYNRQELLQKEMPWYENLAPVFLIVAVPMVLHGLYDTLLKKDQNAAALGVAIVSFLFLAFQLSRLHGSDDEAANKALLKEYARRRLAKR
jgi:RsiW-degrading membrane proteinase PrsW (M82 family)